MSAYTMRGGAALAALLLAWPAIAQQAPASDPHHPADAATGTAGTAQQAPTAAAPAAPAPGAATGMMGTGPSGMPMTGYGPGGMPMMGYGPGGMPMMGYGPGSMGMMGYGPGGMGMMGYGSGGMPMMMGGGHGPHGIGMMHPRGGDNTPMNVIINVGPGVHVDVEDEDGDRSMGRRYMMRGTPGAVGGGMPGRDMPWGSRAGAGPDGPMAERLHDMLAERVEGSLAFLRTELHVRPDQEAAWNAFATRIRAAASQFRTARDRAAVSAPDAGLEQRLAAREARLNADLERIRACREATATLLPALDDAQRRTIDTLSWLVVPGGRPSPMARSASGPIR